MSTQFILQASDQVQPTTLVSKCLLVGHACTYRKPVMLRSLEKCVTVEFLFSAIAKIYYHFSAATHHNTVLL